MSLIARVLQILEKVFVLEIDLLKWHPESRKSNKSEASIDFMIVWRVIDFLMSEKKSIDLFTEKCGRHQSM